MTLEKVMCRGPFMATDKADQSCVAWRRNSSR